jgi:alcohol dehydrogenase class IV
MTIFSLAKMVGDNLGKMMQFEFATTARIIFGQGKTKEAGALAKSIGNRVMLVSGLSDELSNRLLEILSNEGITTQIFSVSKEPTSELVQDGVAASRGFGSDLVIAFGGGSAVDAGKAIAALVTNPGEPLDYLEVIGAGKPLTAPPLPFIAIPTTAGTGAEVTRNAVLASPEHRVKVSLRSPLMLPKLAIIDPELTLSLPPSITASTGLDALTQCIEPFVSHLANPLTDGICREGIKRAARSLRQAFEQGDDLEARENMCLASLFGGLALANAKLGAVHGFAGPLGGMYPSAPHGVICGRLLPFVIEANVRALHSRDPKNPALNRFDEVGRILVGDPQADAVDGVTWIQEMASVLAVPSLSTYGVNESDLDSIIEKAQRASSMKGNPIKLTNEELWHILEMAL